MIKLYNKEDGLTLLDRISKLVKNAVYDRNYILINIPVDIEVQPNFFIRNTDTICFYHYDAFCLYYFYDNTGKSYYVYEMSVDSGLNISETVIDYDFKVSDNNKEFVYFLDNQKVFSDKNKTYKNE